MEVLELDGEKFVKANSIAKELGYTADYVGQLCRAQKVEAHLVGRSWYVSEEALRAHKTTRYRSSKTKTAEALKVSLTKVSETPPTPAPIVDRNESKNFYSKIAAQQYSYDEDQTELIPILKRKTVNTDASIPVIDPDAQKLPIKETNEPYAISFSERPSIRFRGALKIQEAESETESESTPTTVATVVIDTKKQAPKTVAKDTTHKKIPLRRNGVIGMRREGSGHAVATPVEELAISNHSSQSPHRSHRGIVLASVGAVLALLIVTVIFVTEERVLASAEIAHKEYTLNYEWLKDEFKAYKYRYLD